MRHGDFGVVLKHAGHQAIAANVVNALNGIKIEKRKIEYSNFTLTF